MYRGLQSLDTRRSPALRKDEAPGGPCARYAEPDGPRQPLAMAGFKVLATRCRTYESAAQETSTRHSEGTDRPLPRIFSNVAGVPR